MASILARCSTSISSVCLSSGNVFTRTFAWHSISHRVSVVLPIIFMHAAQASMKDIEEGAAEATDDDDDDSNAVVTCTICLSAYEEEEVVSVDAAPQVAVCFSRTTLCSRGTYNCRLLWCFLLSYCLLVLHILTVLLSVFVVLPSYCNVITVLQYFVFSWHTIWFHGITVCFHGATTVVTTAVHVCATMMPQSLSILSETAIIEHLKEKPALVSSRVHRLFDTIIEAHCLRDKGANTDLWLIGQI